MMNYVKRRYRNWIAATLALLMCMSTCLCACTPQGEQPAGDDESNAASIEIIGGGVCHYRVVRPEMCNGAVVTAGVQVRDALQDILGGTVEISDDYVMRGETIPTDAPEILVGLTNRQESIDVHAALLPNEYAIKMVGKRLVIVGYDDERTTMAVKEFLKLLPAMTQDTENGKQLTIKEDYSYMGEYTRKVWLDEFDKTSYSYYADENLTYKEKLILGFDDSDGFVYPNSTKIMGKVDDGIGFTCKNDNAGWRLISTPTDSFSLRITDKFKQTIKMWVYVNDYSLMACDHDAVYGTPQVGSQTLYITLSEEQGGIGHTWQHTFYGNGWHEIELSFTCHNVAYPNLEKINYDNLTSLGIWCNAKAGLEVYFDEMRLCTYDNPNYTEPEAPYGGRWLTTCDYDALDGPILTEWYGAYYDLEEMVQGNASLAITGHNENVDHRVCIGIDDVDVVYEEDTICFDMYISDLSLLGLDWQIRLEHNAQAAHYSVDYNMIASSVVDDRMRSTNLKNGWNHIQLPLSKTRVSIGADYVDQFTNDLTLTQLVFYIAGTGKTEEQNYLIRYDNMYVAKTADLQAAKDAMK